MGPVVERFVPGRLASRAFDRERRMDLTTHYMGLRLNNPLIASAAPQNGEIKTLRALEDHGAGAVVLPSIFEEEIDAERHALERQGQLAATGSAEAQSYFPLYGGYGFGPERYLDIVRRAKQAVAIPVIASLNCVSGEVWAEYARDLEQAGADAIELNIYFIAADPTADGRAVEQRYIDTLKAVKAVVAIPVAVKLSPYFSGMAAMAHALAGEGADALVLFNRFYQPDIDLVTLELKLDLELSTPAEMRLPLLWIAVLHGRVGASLGASTGVEAPGDVLKYLLAGADTVMTTSALLRHGIPHMKTLIEGLTTLLAARGVASLADVRGRMSQRHLKDPAAFERANYIHILHGHPVRRDG
ncbi:dihydroorotate dehydrogenase-like protein [Sphingobium sp. PNB]|nr:MULTISPECIES: dihydroorotate dehydrogenase-like protein [unclassified Sphingobium]MCB4858718.1 dihydroorotate dehydrogenase-like protein [Sphingobium sp. PNB]